MNTRSSTADKILDVARQLFNNRGFAATSTREIAEALAISKGNLTYHFPTKAILATTLMEAAARSAEERRTALASTSAQDDVADVYVEHLLYAMRVTWDYRFLLRDRGDLGELLATQDEEFSADFDELQSLVERIADEGLFRSDAVDDLRALTRSLWIVSRYWMDYLREFEGRDDIRWSDQRRGIEQHFTLLLPCLTAPARRRFTAALERAAP